MCYEDYFQDENEDGNCEQTPFKMKFNDVLNDEGGS